MLPPITAATFCLFFLMNSSSFSSSSSLHFIIILIILSSSLLFYYCCYLQVMELEVTSSIFTSMPKPWLSSRFGKGRVRNCGIRENYFYKRLLKRNFLEQYMHSLTEESSIERKCSPCYNSLLGLPHSSYDEFSHTIINMHIHFPLHMISLRAYSFMSHSASLCDKVFFRNVHSLL